MPLGLNSTVLLTLEEIYAIQITDLKRSAERFIGKEIADAIIAVPSFFSDNQRSAIKNAAEIASLNVMIKSAPSAILKAYLIDEEPNQAALVFHLGGETAEASIVSIDYSIVEIEGIDYNIHLGGNYFNRRLSEYLKQ